MMQVSTRVMLPFGLALVAVWLLMQSFNALAFKADKADNKNTLNTSNTLNRPHDPVIVAGAVLSHYESVPLEELVLYRYRAGMWEPILFQVDEVDASGVYTTSDGSTLDANDEFVFMGFDAGESTETWPADAEARANSRVVIQVADPLKGGVAWAYLYRSTTLPRASGERYVSWNESTQSVTAISYTAAFTPSAFVGLADLYLNGSSVDILDRQKLRLESTVTVGGTSLPQPTVTEESILEFDTLFPTPMTITLPITGPVRAISGRQEFGRVFYAARYEEAVALPLSDTIVPTPFGEGLLHFDSIRTSFDMEDPANSGMAPVTYFDSNVDGGVTVDGITDTVPMTPTVGWYQISGALGGFVMVEEINPANGTHVNYYQDNGAFDSNDTGDGRSYSDAGVWIDNPNGVVGAVTTLFILPPGTGHVGATMQNQANNPLQVTVTEETYEGDQILHQFFLPLIAK